MDIVNRLLGLEKARLNPVLLSNHTHAHVQNERTTQIKYNKTQITIIINSSLILYTVIAIFYLLNTVIIYPLIY